MKNEKQILKDLVEHLNTIYSRHGIIFDESFDKPLGLPETLYINALQTATSKLLEDYPASLCGFVDINGNLPPYPDKLHMPANNVYTAILDKIP